MATLIHEAALKFGTSGTLNEKELSFLWDAYDADKNGELIGCDKRLRNYFSIKEHGALQQAILIEASCADCTLIYTRSRLKNSKANSGKFRK
jgi:hypothetical protein